ncbi:MAG: glucose-6-phosphate isomerase [Defluviitaleaceae bacterium]|nr:glucose-6-phosphate isomerase [Defluviitaleaceae bacterium]
MNEMKLRLDYNNMLADFIGDEGIIISDIDAIADKIAAAKKALIDKRSAMAWRDLPYNQDAVVNEIIEYVNWKSMEIDDVVVLGIGGSALGPIAVQQAINGPFWNETKNERGKSALPRIHVIDNIDPETFALLLEWLDIDRTLFSVVSKSGATSETMAQFMIIKEMLETRSMTGAANNIVCTTDETEGNLVKIAKEEGYRIFIIPKGVGGRFSQLCPVGLIPAAFAGIDIRALLAGAAYMDKLSSIDDIYQNPAYMYAILHYLAMERGKNISVMMPYVDTLKYMSDWYAQLWAESLGKKYDIAGNVVNVGPTPVKALGATDQHSQVQLYVEGPFDKVVVFMGVDTYQRDITIPKIYQDIPSLGFLGGATLSQLLMAEQKATEFALVKAQKMNMTITLPEVNEFTVGQLLYMFEVATAFCGELMGINAFDQPGVEEGKNATYALFGRPGYEQTRAELESAPPKNPKYIT